jgi:uncharacterized protein YuzE
MKITYDPDVDVLYIELKSTTPVRTEFNTVPGLAIEYDEEGKVCAVEIEDATQYVDTPNCIEFEHLAPTAP